MKPLFLTLQCIILITFVQVFTCADVQAGADVEFTFISLDDYSYPPSDQVRIDYRIRNVGDEQSYNFYVNAYASQDTLITEDDYYLGHDYVNSMSPGEGQNLTLNGRFPGSIPPGDYYVGMIALCSNDDNPANDTYYNSSTVLIDNSIRPDLAVSNVHISGSIPSHYYPGDRINITVSVDNIGAQKSGEYDIICYVSEDSSITESDYRLGGLTGASSLDPGRGIRSTFYLNLPDNISAGDYYIGAIATCPMETNLDNNEDYGDTITIHAYSPDIIVQSIFFEDVIYKPRDGICVGLVVKNTGVGSANSYDIDFYASTNEYIESTDYYLGSTSEGSLEPDEESSISTSCDFPDDIPNGDYYIGVIIRWSYDNGSGSSKGSSSDLVWIGAPVDIAVQSIGITPGVYLLGDELVIYSLMKNIGEWITESYAVDYYASTDAVITPDDYHIGYVERDELAPGEQHSYDTTYPVPYDIPEGNYYIGAIVTCPKEYELGNNTGCSEETIELAYPAGYDLVFQSIEVTPGEYSPGDELVIYNLIKNVGESNTEGYAVDYYASIDTVITTDDHHIGYVEREGLAPGQQHSYETTCLIPSNLIMGNYYIGAIITCPIGSGMMTNTGCSEETFELVISGGDVSGQMLYIARALRIEFPIRYARVEVYDADDNEDPNDDRVIGRTHTNQDGNYAVVVLNDEMSSQNIYVKVFADSPIGAYPEAEGKLCSVRDEVFDEIYYMKSELYPHPQDGSVVINMTADRKGGEFMVYDSMVESFEKAKTFFDVNMPEITTYWPCEDETSYFDPCDRSIYIAQGDRGDRDVIMHEYGHFIADVYVFAQGSVGEDSTHFWDADLRYHPGNRTDEEARNLAFRESWATLFSVATQYGDTSYPYAGDTKYQDWDEERESEFMVNLETDTDKIREPGEFYEHMNCCALWDIFDDSDDRVDYEDTLSDPNLSKIWTVLLASKPDDIKDFWDGWFASYDDYTSEITRIFQDHRMSFVKPNIPVFPSGQNNPPIADAGRDRTYYQTCAEGAYVFLRGYGSVDPDGDELTYEWRVNDIRVATGVSPNLYVLPGTTIFTLAVTDGEYYDYDSVEITVIPTDPETWITK